MGERGGLVKLLWPPVLSRPCNRDYNSVEVGTNLLQSYGRRNDGEVIDWGTFERKEEIEYYRLEGQCEQNHEDVCRKVTETTMIEEESLYRSTAGNRIKK